MGRAEALAVLSLLALLAVGRWVAADPGSGPFFMADDFAVLEYASHPGNLLRDFGGPHCGVDYVNRVWRPLVTISSGFDAYFFGANPWGNLLAPGLFHLVAAFAFYLLLRRIGGTIPLCALAAAIFLAHPIAQLSAYWGTARADPLALSWMLAGLLVHLRTPEGAPTWRATPLFALGLATKEPACGFLLFAFAVDVAAGRRRAPRAYLPYLLLLAAFFCVRVAALGTPTGGYGFFGALASGRGLRLLLEGMRRVSTFLFWGGGETPSAVVAALGLLLAAIRLVRGASLRASLALLCASAGAIGPLLPLFSPEGDLVNCRPLYLLVPASVGILAAGARSIVALGLVGLPMLLAYGPVPAMRASERFNREVHGAVLDLGRRTPEGSPLLIDLPREEVLVPYRLFWGVDRMHAPPFAPSFRRILLSSPLHPRGRVVDSGAWPILQGLRVGSGEGPLATIASVVGEAAPPVPRRTPDLAGPITADLLEAIARGEVSPGFPAPGRPGEEVGVLFLTGYGSAELRVRVGPGGKVPLKDVLAAPCLAGRAPVPLWYMLMVNLDMEMSPLHYVGLPPPDGGLVEIEFGPSAFSYFATLLRAGKGPSAADSGIRGR
ncbi:MAG: hypothetical protein L0323_12840 [Planctomycetes bacterium]|nr:hypothetical protein [Planctomycetota bacterium]